jgi:signal transduction histidine kinase/pSer/pThr/pTyr-binding forkhead associated (FHA) protein
LDEKPFLKLLLPGSRHRLVPLDADPFLIGRRRDNHLVIAERDISRVQAIIRRENEGFVIEDQQSHFGTTVNGEEIGRHALRNRDVIAFGRERVIEMIFLHDDAMSRILDEVDRTPDRETTREELRSLRILLEISRGMNSFTSLGEMLDLALDAAVDLTKAERGFVMLKDADGNLQMQAARNMAGERIRPENLRISMSIVSEVIQGGRAIYLADAQQSSELRDRSSIAELKLRAIACLPIRIPAAHMITRPRRRTSQPGTRSGISDDVLGVIYTDSSQATRPMQDVTRDLVESIAVHAAISIENFLLRQEEMEHRLMEKEVEKLREVDRLKSDFVSHVSHELRTPLTAIKGSIDNMLDGLTGALSEKQGHYLTRMKNNTDHLVRLINDLLDLSRIEAGQIVLSPHPLAIDRLIGDVCESLRPLATARGVELSPESPADLTLVGDLDRLRQILLNLTGNAIKYTPAGGRIAVKAEPAGENVRIVVSDNGAGFDPKEKDRIFERFYRAGPAGEQPTQGTGLGLSITQSLVQLHGGSISVETALGAGSTFTVTLPVSGPAPRRGATPPPAPPRGSPGAPAAGARGTPRAVQG